TEAMARLNRGILRDFYGEPRTSDDYDMAAQLLPDDPSITKRRTLLLVENKQFDAAVTEARAAYNSARGNDTALFLARTLNERSQTVECEESVRLSSEVVRKAGNPDERSEALLLSVCLLAKDKKIDEAKQLIDQCAKHIPATASETIRSILDLEVGNK